MSLVFGDSQKRITWQKACRCWSSDHLLDPPRGLFFLCLTQRCFAVQLWCLWLLWVQAIRRLQYKFHLYFYNRKLKLQNGVRLRLLQHTFVCAWIDLKLTKAYICIGDSEYEMYHTIIHTGKDASSGHYYAIGRRSTPRRPGLVYLCRLWLSQKG